MKLINRPKIKIQEAFQMLQENNFEDVITESCNLAIEPGCDNVIENMIAITDGIGSFSDLYGVHSNGRRWTHIS